MLNRYRPLYLAGRLARRLLPDSASLRFLSRRHDALEELYGTADYYLSAIRDAGPELVFPEARGLTLLEAGTGVYNPASAPLLLSGVDRLILLEPFVGGDVDRPRLCERLGVLLEQAERDPKYPLARTRTADELLGASEDTGLPSGVELLERSWEDTGLPDESVDYVLSVGVLEHVRTPLAVIQESARILRRGGWMINNIDMRDHFFRYPMEMLKYSKQAWNRLTTSEGGSGYLNRWRLSHWNDAHDAAGLDIVHTTRTFFSDERLAAEKPFFHADFRALPDDVLRTEMATIVATKRGR